MIAKACPKCDQQIHVACKSCPCGHIFLKAKKPVSVWSATDEIRRTQRVRREKPNYYDALEYDRHIKQIKLRNSECENDEEFPKKYTKRKRRVKKEAGEEDMVITLTPEKQAQCSLILDELNRKMQSVMWKPT